MTRLVRDAARPAPDIRPSTFWWPQAIRLVFYTDGPIEAGDRAGRYFRLDDCLETLRRGDLEAAADELLDRVAAHTGRKLDDDVAVLLFEAKSPSVWLADQNPAPSPACAILPGDAQGAAGSGFLSPAAMQAH
jgi:hypothetical protein